MASEYRQIHPRFWSSTRGMDTDVQLMALYCLTAPGSNGAGIFELSCARAGEDLSLSPSRCRTLVDRVCDTLNWRYDEGARVLYIPTWWRWNRPHNVSHLIGCMKRLESLPQTKLWQEFTSNEEYLPNGVLDTFRRRVGEVSAGCSTQNPNQKQNQYPKQNPNPDLSAASAAKSKRPETKHVVDPNEKVRKPREPDPIWDAVCNEFRLKPVLKAEKARVGKIVRDLKAKQATAVEIAVRCARILAAWGEEKLTPESLVKHWDKFDHDQAPKSRGPTHVGAPTGKYDHLEGTG